MMGTTRPGIVVAVAFLLAFVSLWSAVVSASCDDCKTMRCQINCSSYGKRSGTSNRDDLSILHKSKPPTADEWIRRDQCTLDVWFEELPIDWQRTIITLFKMASTYVDPL